MRDRSTGIFANQVVRNRYVWAALALCVVLILLAVLLPFLRRILELTFIPFQGWALVLGMSLVPLAAGQLWLEAAKRLRGLERTRHSPVID